MDIKNRILRLRQRFADKEIEAFFVSQPENLYYLSGCEGLEGYLLITSENVLMATDFRYIEQAERQSPRYEIFRISGKMAEWLPRLFAGSHIKRLGFESSHLSFASYTQIGDVLKKSNPDLSLIPVAELVESIRMVKEPEEVELIARAAKISDAAVDFIENNLHCRLSEKEVAWQIEKYLRDNGSQTLPFELIVAAGPNSALPHAKPSDYIIGAGNHRYGFRCRFNRYGNDRLRSLHRWFR
jgi:Xaa-Pro aminopeptidase